MKVENSGESKERVKINLTQLGFKVSNIRRIGKSKNYSFSLGMPGLSMYGVKAIFKEGEMYVVPADTKVNGEYYKNYYLSIDEESEKMIYDAIMEYKNNEPV